MEVASTEHVEASLSATFPEEDEGVWCTGSGDGDWALLVVIHLMPGYVGEIKEVHVIEKLVLTWSTEYP